MAKVKMLSFLFLILYTFNSKAQLKVNIFGVLKGLGSNKMVYLGNKGDGISPNYNEYFYDSVMSRNDSFEFKKFNFKYFSDYSIETVNKNGWLSFIVDTGNVFIRGHSDTIYRAKIIGSE